MKIVFFCHLPYCFSILKPIVETAKNRGYQILWYLDPDADVNFPYEETDAVTRKMADVIRFNADAIFIPGNDVPHYLRGVKVQVFHGFAGEKKTHFKIRDYFDLYLTQGPYFTARFQQFAEQHKNFEVIETGWSGVDQLFVSDKTMEQRLRQKYSLTKKTILYAPTASASLTSVELTLPYWEELVKQCQCSLLIKFHPLIPLEIQHRYQQKFVNNPGIHIADESVIGPLFSVSDLLVSDTSGVVYEFLLLEKPVVTLNSISPSICWPNLSEPESLISTCLQSLAQSDFPNPVAADYHPYKDGQSAARMLDAVESYIARNGVPEKRKINFVRRRKMNRKYGSRKQCLK